METATKVNEDEVRILCHIKETDSNAELPVITAVLQWLDGKVEIATHMPGQVRPREFEPMVYGVIDKITTIKEAQPDEVLRNMIDAKNGRFELEYWEHRKEFDEVQSVVYEAILKFVKMYHYPPDYNEITKFIHEDLGHPDIKEETLTRRVRELVHPSEGDEHATLISPVKGRYYIKNLPLDYQKELPATLEGVTEGQA